ncbi:MAG: ATPase, T2SS/T4P/T4SS family [Vicinamibacteria bacterium]
MGTILSIYSPKGGTGATLLSVNLAVSLLRETRGTVALIEVAYPIPGDVALHLGLDRPRAVGDVAPVLSRLQPALLRGYLTHHSSGIAVVPSVTDPLQAKSVSPAQIIDFTRLAARAYDFVVLDVSSQLPLSEVDIFELSSAIGLVMTPDVSSLTQTQSAIHYLQSLHHSRDRMRLVLNRYSRKMPFSPDGIEENVGLPISLYLADDPDLIRSSLASGTPFVIGSPRHPVSKSLDKFTAELVTAVRSGVLPPAGPDRPAQSPPFGNVTHLHPRSGDWSSANDARDIKIRVHRRLVEEIDLKKADLHLAKDASKAAELRSKTEVKIVSLLDEEAPHLQGRDQRKQLVREILDEALGLGPLESLLRDDGVTEIMVNGIDHIYVERAGKIVLTPLKFLSNEQLRGVIERIVTPLGRRIDEKSPMVDARLADGSRVNAIIPPLALNGACLTIRKFSRTPLNVSDLVTFGSFTPQMSRLFEAAVLARQNIVISGGTGAGKTTLLNVLSSFIPAGDRIVTIEDSAELRLPQIHVARLESRPPNIEGEGAITIRDLVRNALRMRPDRIVVGECRSGEALDMLQAMNTGHDGSLTTVHANSPRDALARLETMSLMAGLDLPAKAIRNQIASAVDLVIQQNRAPDGSRRVTHVSEVNGIEGDVFTMSDIFLFKQTGTSLHGKVQGQLVPTGVVPKFVESLQERGITVPREIFLHQTA